MVPHHDRRVVTHKPLVRPEKAGKYVRREHLVGELTRTIELPQTIQLEHITAAFAHGMLLLHVPKAKHLRPCRIPITVEPPKSEKPPVSEKAPARPILEEALTY